MFIWHPQVDASQSAACGLTAFLVVFGLVVRYFIVVNFSLATRGFPDAD